MNGTARAAARRADANTLLAYQALTFYGLAQSGKLKAVSHYLIDKPKPRRQTTDEMLAVFREFAGRGAAMNIQQVN
jgi:hypothetical protein